MSSRHSMVLAMSLAIGLGVIWLAAGNAQAQSGAVDVYKKIYPSTVQIKNATGGTGTGVILSADGYVLTNAHVVSLPPRFSVVVETRDAAGKKQYLNYRMDPKAPVKLHKKYDVALIKIDPAEHGIALPPAKFRDTEVFPGEVCYAIGHPLGNTKAITNGIVTTPDSKMNGLSHIQATVTVQGGNSGGPLCDKDGLVIGLVTYFTRDERGSQALAGSVPRAAFTKEAIANDFIPWRKRPGDPKIAEAYLKNAEAFERRAREIIEQYGAPNKESQYLQSVAAQLYQRAIAANPTDPRLYKHIAWLAILNKQPKVAETFLMQGIMVAPDKAKELFALLGWALLDLKKEDDAKAAAEESLVRDPQSPLSWVSLARVHFKKKKFDVADLYAKIALKLEAKSSERYEQYTRQIKAFANDARFEYRNTGDPEQDDVYVSGEMQTRMKNLVKKNNQWEKEGGFATKGFAAYMKRLTPASKPTAVSRNFATTQGDTLKVAAATGLAKGCKPGEDPEAKLVIKLKMKPKDTEVAVKDDGSFTFKSEKAGQFVFTYEVLEGKVASVPARVTVTVLPKINPPSAADDTFSVVGGRSLRVRKTDSLLGNDNAANGKPLTAKLQAKPKNGTVVLEPDGSFMYRPKRGFVGKDQFTYVAIEDGNASAPATVVIEVTSMVNQRIIDKITTAKLLHQNGRKANAVAMLRQLVQLYPDQPATKTARELLEQWQD